MHAFDTIRAVRGLPQRHPDAAPSVVLVAYAMASYADGATGTNIRPGVARLASDTGLHARTVEYAIAWLVDRGEIRRDKAGHRGSAACFSWIGGMGKAEESPQAIPMPAKRKPAGSMQKATVIPADHQPDQPSLSAYAPSSPSTQVTEGANENGKLAHRESESRRANAVCQVCKRAPATTTHDHRPVCAPCRNFEERRLLYEAEHGALGQVGVGAKG